MNPQDVAGVSGGEPGTSATPPVTYRLRPGELPRLTTDGDLAPVLHLGAAAWLPTFSLVNVTGHWRRAYAEALRQVADELEYPAGLYDVADMVGVEEAS